MKQFELEVDIGQDAAPGRNAGPERYQIRIAGRPEDFGGLWPSSRDLGDACAYVFQCADVVEAWIDSFGCARNTEVLLVLVADADGNPLMALPLGIETHSGLRVLSFLDAGVSDYNAPILYPRGCDMSGFPRLWGQLLNQLPKFDILLLTKLPSRIYGVENPMLQLPVTEGMVSGHCATLPSMEEAPNRVPPEVKNLRRRQRRLAEVGQVSFIVAVTPEDRERVLREIIRHKTRKYLETRGFDGFECPGFRDYYVELTKRSGPNGPVHLIALLVEDKIVAGHWGMISADRLYSLLPAFDREWARYGPGRILLEELIEWGIKNGYRSLDFGVGDEPYKDDYCEERIPLYEHVAPRTFRGFVAASLYRTVKGLKRTGLWQSFKNSAMGRQVRGLLKR
jgi:CelD/BcsL family acetyltransferase involved in cellulose biosynthesis